MNYITDLMRRNRAFALAVALLFVSRVRAEEFDVATATNRVGLDLFRKLDGTSQSGNFAISPYSVESALALAYAGAAGETRTEMARVLGFPEDDRPLQAAFASMRGSMDRIASESARLEKLREKWEGPGDVIEWHAANRLFGQQGSDLRSSFLKLLEDGYGAPFEAVDFKNHADQERRRINVWLEDQTEKKIRELIPESGITPATRLVLVNALYLKAPWASPFTESETVILPFNPARSEPEGVPTMRETKNLGYLKGSDYTAVTIPYQGGGLQFLILLPDDRQGLRRLINELTPASLRACANIDESHLVDLYLPKFRLDGSTVNLGKSLQDLGMKTAFDLPKGSANFDSASPRRPDDYFAISGVFHKTFVMINEHGTEAAAATAIAMASFGIEMNPPKPIEVHVNHPFLFAIQHRDSGICLFLGSVGDPR
jgi:serpin B